MDNPRPFSLAPLTVLPLTPPEVIDVAASGGYDYAGLRLLPAAPGGTAYGLMDDPVQLEETLARSAATGVRIFDLELIRIGTDFDTAQYLPFFDVGARLGARAVLVVGDDPVPARLAESYARLCAVMRPYGFTADLEFMPWTAMPNLRSALEVIAAAGRPGNAGVLVDALHYACSDTRLDEIVTIPRQWLHYAQICDAPAAIPETDAEYIHAGRCERLLPGEGGIGLRELYARLPADLPISVEIPNDLRAPACGYREWARQALVATRAVLDAQART